MQYNIHPIFVHFPIAFLLLYSVIVIFPFSKWMPKVAWKDIRRVLLLAGVAGALLANSTGEIAEEFVSGQHDLIDMHAFFAGASIFFYAVLLGSEFLPFVNQKIISRLNISPITKLFSFLEKLLTKRSMMILLSVLGLLAISLTGLLGGVLVYGESADPLAPIVLKILGL